MAGSFALSISSRVRDGAFPRRALLASVSLLAVFAVFFEPVRAQTYRFTYYTVNTGLPHNSVYAIHQDHHGYIWFGTEAGACRYDGANYVTLGPGEGLVDPVVRSFCEDGQGRLWIATEGGISCWDGRAFLNYGPAQGLADKRVYSALCSRDGRLWFGTAKGLSCFDGQKFTNYGQAEGVPPGLVWKLVENSSGALWMGLRGGGLAKFENGRVTALGRPDGVANENVFGLALDPNGGLWMATSGGLQHFDGRRFRTYGLAEGLGTEMTGNVLIDRHGRVWVTTFGKGLARLDDGRFKVFNRANGIFDNYLTAIFQDYEGNLWCGTRSSGAFRFSGEEFSGYTAAHGLHEGRIAGMGETADGTLWIASVNGGLASLDPRGRVRRYGKKDGLTDEGLWSLCIDRRGRIWTGDYRTVYCLESGRVRRFSVEQVGTGERVTAMCEDRLGNVWFGTYGSTAQGVVRYDGREFTRYSTKDGLADNSIQHLFCDRQGTLWVSGEVGLSRFDGERFTTYRVEDGLPSRRVTVSFEDSAGRLWVGTNNGLCRLDAGRFQTYTTADGLVGNVIRTLIEADGKLWIGTSRGISVFDGAQFRNFTTNDGLTSDDIAPGVCLLRGDGVLWFGTNEGITCRRPAKEIAQSVAPRVRLSTVRIEERSIDVVPTDDPVRLSLPQLDYDENTVTFEFVGLSFVNENLVRYGFFLDGFDRKWSPPTAARSARFTNLPPGTYTFWVKACSAAGVWGEPQKLTVTIRPPFWRTWWFGILAVSALFSFAVGLYMWQIRLMKHRQEQKIALLRHMQRQRITTLRQLLESIRVINSQLDLPTVLEKIAEESAQLVDGDPGGIGFVEENRLVFKRVWNQGRWDETNIVFNLGEGVAGKTAADGHSRIVNDPKTHPDVVAPELFEKYGIRGLMDIPIIDRNGRVVGVLDVRRPEGRGDFTEEDLQLIESLANQAAVAIENAALYGELEEKRLLVVESMRELETLYRQEREVTRTLQELNRMKSNFITVTSHELRTPLTVLKGYTDVLLDEYLGPLTGGQRQSLDTCRRMVDRMVINFNDLLEMLKINEGRAELSPAPCDLCAIARRVSDELSGFVEQRRQRLIFDGPAELPLTADEGKTALVLTNLIQNAIKFTHDDGEIRVVVRRVDDTAHLTVEDTGMGIDPAEIGRIFDKFYTTNDPSTHRSGRFEFAARGAGLGLAIAKSYVEAHGGRIWAESEGLGKGSRFHLVLPLECAAHEVVAGVAATDRHGD